MIFDFGGLTTDVEVIGPTIVARRAERLTRRAKITKPGRVADQEATTTRMCKFSITNSRKMMRLPALVGQTILEELNM